MHQRKILGLKEAMMAVKAVLAETKALPGRPIAVAVLDDHGDLMAFACEAGVNPALARQNALRKAYTSACMRTDTMAFGERFAGMMRSIADTANLPLTHGGGGVVLKDSEGLILGGLGVSGRPDGAEDEALAQAGLHVLRQAGVAV
jgi:uncharacterized protein GlcG (DUF336 family)